MTTNVMIAGYELYFQENAEENISKMYDLLKLSGATHDLKLHLISVPRKYGSDTYLNFGVYFAYDVYVFNSRSPLPDDNQLSKLDKKRITSLIETIPQEIPYNLIEFAEKINASIGKYGIHIDECVEREWVEYLW